jgi:hypothetical protein
MCDEPGRKKTDDGKPKQAPGRSIKPVSKRVAEPDTNLKQRGEWFRKRSQRHEKKS